MDDVLLVRRCEPQSKTIAQAQNLVGLQPPAAKHLLERLAADELHDQIPQTVLIPKKTLITDDRIVVHAAELAGLLAKRVDDLRIFGKPREDHFDRVLGP